MRRLSHPNIVNLLGVAPQEDPVMIILELCPNGSLHKKLRNSPEIPVKKLVSYATDAARGMVYLSLRKIIHRDIAARNCLISKTDEVKISDFGLSVADKNVISVDKLRHMPVRWLAPETLRKGEFSTKTDVWAFGVMLWEIFSRCKTEPFPGLSNAQARLKVFRCHKFSYRLLASNVGALSF
ncbi:unnamed protein product [Gongylonema pulchrum]|nr:unnamed protein product [Gongylonema pulchrum]